MSGCVDVNDLLKLVKSDDEIKRCAICLPKCVRNTYENCFSSTKTDCSKHLVFAIDSVIDFLQDELNTGHWSEVPIIRRRTFSSASFIKVMCCASVMKVKTEANLSELLRYVDLGLLLGAPLIVNNDLLTKTAALLSTELQAFHTDDKVYKSTQKRKSRIEYHNTYSNINGTEIPTLQCPSIEQFNTLYFDKKMPVKLQDCISHWPASKKWLDINYFIKLAGHRTVPIEIGSHYADDNWSQKLITLQEFIKQHFLGSPKEVGYLAQHNLFQQIPELKDDIFIPDYCCLSRNYKSNDDVDINAWFGPEGTVSPLHFDPKDNLLSQVFGTKQIILCDPKDSKYLYPYEGKFLNNTAQVNPTEPNLDLHPLFSQANVFKCLLEPGEMLFIPAKWWHHVTALDKSFSVSFWWE